MLLSAHHAIHGDLLGLAKPVAAILSLTVNLGIKVCSMAAQMISYHERGHQVHKAALVFSN